MRHALQRPVLMHALKFSNANTGPGRALEKADSGKSLNLYSSRNVDTHFRAMKDRSWRIVVKIATKTFYLVSSFEYRQSCLKLFSVVVVAVHRKKETTVKSKCNCFNVKAGGLDVCVCVDCLWHLMHFRFQFLIRLSSDVILIDHAFFLLSLSL